MIKYRIIKQLDNTVFPATPNYSLQTKDDLENNEWETLYEFQSYSNALAMLRLFVEKK